MASRRFDIFLLKRGLKSVKNSFVKALLLAGLLMTAGPAPAQSPEVQRMLDEVMKKAPQDLKDKMQGEMRRQKEGTRLHSPSITFENFLDGVWILYTSNSDVLCGRREPDSSMKFNGSYRDVENFSFLRKGSVLTEKRSQWQGPQGWVVTEVKTSEIIESGKATQQDIKELEKVGAYPIGYIKLRDKKYGNVTTLYFKEGVVSDLHSYAGKLITTGGYFNIGVYKNCSGQFISSSATDISPKGKGR